MADHEQEMLYQSTSINQNCIKLMLHELYVLLFAELMIL